MTELTPELQPRWNRIITAVLGEFIQICKNEQFTYFCCGGTAIGAVRHGGMIPWDDDIDVFMPRPDYDRFVEYATTRDLGHLEIVTPYTHPTYPLYFVKLCDRRTTLQESADVPCIYGLYIDIFPIDGAPDDIEEAKALARRYTKTGNKLEAISTHTTFAKYIGLLANPHSWGRFVRKTIAFFFRTTYRSYLLRQIESICRKYPFGQGVHVANYCGANSPKAVFPREWISGAVSFKFEGLTVDLPAGYDQYLRYHYGDYMQLPPVEERKSHHYKAFFDLDKRIE